ncbi:cellulose biosynthesis cyclic di-GMP-binding regulatory protein BcsB [Patulibacter sp.]|uniref:cellulose biosynthesis cyclic di-GMP-binding regulatory protein BcsB n=1 Tax=Patulibacter sp. TaxID=1912859 RepID=UPI00271BE413|nr:cellulose biosynthesis cyclic di-GMP-binding regulatory protein BcsB [Patulibacter sp.]MDO9409184.1 cellulose biosynthesis cyclic di-GMP-binding regulatory protein BcsB [Patulibacter sp.]
MTPAAPRRSTRLIVAAATGALLGLAAPAVAGAAPTTVPLAGPDDAAVRFGGGLDQYAGGIPVPVRWTSVGGRVRLSWRASQQLSDRSGLQVRVGDTVVGSTNLGAGPGSATFTIPRTALRGSSRTVPVAIDTRLQTDQAQCPTPDDPAAWLQLDRSAAVTVDGSAPATLPRLKELPGALVAGVGRRRGAVLVRFTGRPTPDAIRAASVAVGEVAAAAEGQGVAVRVAVAGTPTRRRVGESVVTIAEGAAVPRVHTEVVGTDRAAVVVVEGRGEGLLRAAGALRPAVARTLPGTSASGSALPAVTVRRATVPRRVRLPTGGVTGLDTQEVSLGFRIPEWREVLRGSRLRLAGTYDAPAGGRAVVAINGRDLVGEPLTVRGPSRFVVEEALAPRGPALYRGDLRAGDNSVTIRTRLNRPRDLRCTPQEFDAGALDVQESGSVTLQTRPRPVTSTLSVLPFPLNRNPGWRGTTVALPASPTEAELGAVIGTLAEARRVSRELVLPAVQLGGDTPAGTALVLARPGAVPGDLAKGVPGQRTAGVLTATKSGDAVRVLAIGPKALLPLANAYAVGKVQGRTVEALSSTRVAIRVPDAELVTGIERGPVPYRWPLIIIGVAILAFAVLALRATSRRLRRRTAGSAPPPDGSDGDPRP